MGKDGWVWACLTIASIAVAVLLFMVGPAPAQDRGAWFKSLRMPGSGVSCCDISDCKQTDAQWQAGGWWAVSPYHKRLVPIPDGKVLKKPMSIDGEAYLCEGQAGTIFCFVPPSPGS